MSDGKNPEEKKDLTGIFEVDSDWSTPASETLNLESEHLESDPFEIEAEPQDLSATDDINHTSEPTDILDDLRQYSENSLESSTRASTVPFHLYIQGKFGPYERDKLLRFITDHSVGVSSSDLDTQIQAGKVFFSRISEYAGIRLIQDLRDSGLDFHLTPSDTSNAEVRGTPEVETFHFSAEAVPEPTRLSIPILPAQSDSLKLYEAFDSIQGVQYLKAETVEIEKSELFQEIVDRLTESLKSRARLKGAQALTDFSRTITPLRLPSQYQIAIEATLLRKK